MATLLWPLLKHYIGDDPATAKLMDPDALDPGFLPKPAAPVAPGGRGNRLRTPPPYTEDPDLQTCVAQWAKKSPYSAMQFAVADLSKSPAEFAGHGAATMGYAASISKVAAMYAVHQLQFDLTVLATQKRLTTAADLFKAARAEWAATQTWDKKAATKNVRGLKVQGDLVLVGGSPVNVPIHNSSHADASGFPKLEEIFDVSVVGGKPKVEFQKLSALAASSAARTAMLDYLEASDSFKAAKDALEKANARNRAELQKKRDDAKAEWDTKLDAMKFAELMFLMIDDSDNRCTARCTQNIGYAYIASALVQSGLYDVSRGGGLWLGFDYFGGPNFSPPVGGPVLAASPGTMVTFLTLLHNRKLVNRSASKSMLELMDKQKTVLPRGRGSLNRSPFDEGLRNKKYVKQSDGSFLRTEVEPGGAVLAPAAIYSKLGLDDLWCDFALIQRNSKTYAAACLVAEYPRPQALIRELDKCVMANP